MGLRTVSNFAQVALALLATPAFCQQPDLDLMLKWSAASIVHYDITGDCVVEDVGIANGDYWGVRSAKATDRVEISFDWDQGQYQIVGQPALKNFPTSTQQPEANPRCGPVSLDGAYEHVTVKAIGRAIGPSLELPARRDYPAAEIPYFGETECGVDHAVARSEDLEFGIVIPPSTYFGMPNGALGPDVMVIPEKDTIVLTDRPNGWVWIYRLTLVGDSAAGSGQQPPGPPGTKPRNTANACLCPDDLTAEGRPCGALSECLAPGGKVPNCGTLWQCQ